MFALTWIYNCYHCCVITPKKHTFSLPLLSPYCTHDHYGQEFLDCDMDIFLAFPLFCQEPVLLTEGTASPCAGCIRSLNNFWTAFCCFSDSSCWGRISTSEDQIEWLRWASDDDAFPLPLLTALWASSGMVFQVLLPCMHDWGDLLRKAIPFLCKPICKPIHPPFLLAYIAFLLAGAVPYLGNVSMIIPRKSNSVNGSFTFSITIGILS